MRNLAWLASILMVIGVAAALNRPRAESRPPVIARKREPLRRQPPPMPEPPRGFSYTGPLVGEWRTIICTTPVGRTYRADGIVEYYWGFGEPIAYATFEVDDTHYPPVVITTEIKRGRVIKDYSIWKITAQGKLREESFKPEGPIPTSFSKDPDPLLFSRSR